MTMAIFLMLAGLVLILVARRSGRRRPEAKAVERAVLRAMRRAKAEACPAEARTFAPLVGRIVFWALAAALILGVVLPALAQTPSLTCQDSGNMRHCWNERGETVLTQERSPGGYTHSWDNRGHSCDFRRIRPRIPIGSRPPIPI
jgi:hypothetical protein